MKDSHGPRGHQRNFCSSQINWLHGFDLGILLEIENVPWLTVIEEFVAIYDKNLQEQG